MYDSIAIGRCRQNSAAVLTEAVCVYNHLPFSVMIAKNHLSLN